MKKISDILGEHSFFEDLSQTDLEFIAGCGKNLVFEDKMIIAKPGDPADEFYLIRHGQVALFAESKRHEPFIYQTLGKNEILGLAWLIPPYRWNVTAQAEQTTRVIAFNGACIREKCEKDMGLGYKLMKHLAQVLVAREEAARLQLLDVYGTKKG